MQKLCKTGEIKSKKKDSSDLRQKAAGKLNTFANDGTFMAIIQPQDDCARSDDPEMAKDHTREEISAPDHIEDNSETVITKPKRGNWHS